MILICPLTAQTKLDFGLTPKIDGTFSTFLQGNLDFGTRFYTRLRLEYVTVEVVEEGQGTNLSTIQQTKNQTFSIGWAVLGVDLINRDFRMGLALSAEYIYLGSDEQLTYTADPGYEIIPGYSSLVLSSDRVLNVLLPTLDLRIRYSKAGFWTDWFGEYAPVLFVGMNQLVDSTPIYPGFNEDGPVSHNGTYLSYHSFSAKGELGHQNNVLSVSLGGEFTRLPIKYETITLGGIQEIDSIIYELKFNGDVILSFLSLWRMSPLISVEFSRSWSEIYGMSSDITFHNRWSFYFGVSAR